MAHGGFRAVKLPAIQLWNFGKFLIGKDGKPIARFEPKDPPDGEAIVTAIEKALAPWSVA